jgi:flavin reductase (DIM6/NTAB) family NADH-FMN oxidoreductase RutF
MRTKLNITEGIFPMPVLMVATYNEDGSVNVMNAAWGNYARKRYCRSQPYRES